MKYTGKQVLALAVLIFMSLLSIVLMLDMATTFWNWQPSQDYRDMRNHWR